MSKLTHVDENGAVRMVDVTAKGETVRHAVAGAMVTMRPETLSLINENRAAKGNVLECARIAGIMAAKRTPDMIPMCHPLPVTGAEVAFFPEEETSSIRIEASVRVTGRTGVEMEALCAAAVAALTVYDMCKAVDRGMVISDVRLLEKSGGASGEFRVPAR
ncbi:MAG: cyclic pyranopterin monophosphate synthase MoaC [Desulfatibacillaceae bacterium]